MKLLEPNFLSDDYVSAETLRGANALRRLLSVLTKALPDLPATTSTSFGGELHVDVGAGAGLRGLEGRLCRKSRRTPGRRGRGGEGDEDAAGAEVLSDEVFVLGALGRGDGEGEDGESERGGWICWCRARR
jgi:hypothetical protein